MHAFILALPLILAASAAPSAAPAGPAFPVIRFFEGRTEGEGTLKVITKAAVPVRVESLGRVERHGGLVLVQKIREGAKPERTRSWRMREVSPGRYTGALTDAMGPVNGEAKGNRLRIAYRMKGGFDAEQWLTLAPGGRSTYNKMTVKKFGVTIATVEETIRKLD
jgi:hypothetical protein